MTVQAMEEEKEGQSCSAGAAEGEEMVLVVEVRQFSAVDLAVEEEASCRYLEGEWSAVVTVMGGFVAGAVECGRRLMVGAAAADAVFPVTLFA